MKILWFTWKDITHPHAGGAEVVTHELSKRLVAGGHDVTLLTAGYTACKSNDMIDGYRVVRVGGRWSVYWHAYRYYKKNLSTWADLIVEEVNTLPFFTRFYAAKVHRILFFHQLCREIWFYQLFFPVSAIGYIMEPVYLYFLSSKIRFSTLWTFRTFDSPKVITVSQSTKNDLIRYGFDAKKIHIISEGIMLTPVKDVQHVQKYTVPTLLALGAVRCMKRTDHVLRAFAIAKKSMPQLRLIVAGKLFGRYGKKVSDHIARSPYVSDIMMYGHISDEEKSQLMQKSHVSAVASVKEGWGLVITELNSQGTPAVVYNVDGLRDSVRDGETGIVCEKNTPEDLAKNIVALLQDHEKYAVMQKNAWEWSKEINFDRSYQDFKKVLEI